MAPNVTCTWTSHDCPGAARLPHKTITVRWHFLGVICDVCNNWTIRAINSFDMRVHADRLLSVAKVDAGEWRQIGRGQTAWHKMQKDERR